MIFEIETILGLLVLILIGTGIIYSGNKKKTEKKIGLTPKSDLVPEGTVKTKTPPRKSIKKKKSVQKTTKISTTEKGRKLELEFAKYMKNHLGYSDVKLGERVVGLDDKNTDIDILGLRKEVVGKHNRIRYTWVECKNHQKKVGLPLLRVFKRDVEYYKKSKNADYNITDLYFVASSGFTPQALGFAKAQNIFCYKKGQHGFDLEENP